MISSLRDVVSVAALVTALSLSACAERPVRLLENGSCSHRVVLEPDASPSEKHAAEELQTHFKACTGAELSILEKAPDDEMPMIVLGCGPVAQSLGVDPDAASLGEQGFLLRTVPPHIVIAGTREAGTLYGVYRFLEEYLGVRWYAPGVTKTPRATDIAIPSTARLVQPAFLWRHTSYAWPGKDADFLVRVADNWGGGNAESPRGIQHSHDGRAHSYFRFIKPGEFFETHPEYFSEIGGVRTAVETQLCLTNPDVLEIVTGRMLARMKNSPNVRQHNFSQMDYYNCCECPECRAMNEKYGTAGGTQFWFVNKLAERTSEVYPDKLIGTLAYTYTEEPPKGMKMHPNVAVWLCHMFPSCDSHPIATCPLDANYKRRAIEWSKICSHLYIWHYCVDYAHYYNPFPNFRALSADMKFYHDIGVEGIYLSGMGHGGGGGEFSLLRPYYGMKLLWNPEQNADTLIKDFLQGYYAAAWKPMWEYIVMLHDKVENENIHMHLYTNPAQGYLTDDVVERAMALFDQAEAAVKDDPELLERVRVARMPLTYARMFPRNGYKIKGNRLVWQGEIASLTQASDFISRMQKQGFRTVREDLGAPEHLMLVSGMLRTSPKVVHISNEHLGVDVVPMLAGRALRIVHRKTRKCGTAYNVKRDLFFPFCGGLENRVGESFRFYGWIEPATVVKQTKTSLTLTIQTVNGFQLKRTLTLKPKKPVLHVQSTLTNPAKKPMGARLRSHIQLNLGELQKTRVRFTSLSGKKVDKDMTDIIAALREGEYYYDQDRPRGSWTFIGTKGLQVTQSFDNDVMDFTWLYAYPDYLGELEVELWAKRKVLGPGESVTISQDIEVKPTE